jgi:S-adenosyl-L-methionine hydrolase (adenosine-forming)
MSKIVTLLTDFGTQDGYVAEMKGVMLKANCDLNIVDISHSIPAQDVAHGAYVLGCVQKQFPADTIHVGVVDPGVGTARRAIVISHASGTFVGPDNGLFTAALADGDVISIHEIGHDAGTVSRTFHGRDVFAPAAAQLSLGVSPGELGPALSDPVKLSGWSTTVDPSGVTGSVLHIDRFGNAITNISAELLVGRTIAGVSAGECEIDRISDTYGDVRAGDAVGMIGSQDTLEIGVNGGSASDQLEIKRGMDVVVRWDTD